MSFQQITLKGNVGQKRVADANGKKVVNLTVAQNKVWYEGDGDNRTKREVTNWFDVAVWGQKAEFADKYINSGDDVLVVGEVEIGSYAHKDHDDVKIKTFTIRADVIEKGGKKPAE